MSYASIYRVSLLAATLMLALPASFAADEGNSKFHDCDGIKMEIFEPKDGVMEARVDDLVVRISVAAAGYSVSVQEGNRQTSTSAQRADEALRLACNMVSSSFMAKARSDELDSQLSELYDSL